MTNRYEPINWLREQSIRMRRIKWPNAWMLADELWLILSSLEPPTTGKLTVNSDDTDEGTYTMPALEDLYIPPLDLTSPDRGTYQPDNEQEETSGGQFQSTTKTCFWYRAPMLAQITGEGDVAGNFPVTLYPNAELGNQCTNQWQHDPEDPYSFDDTAVCKGDDDNVETDDWVVVFHAAQWLKEETTIRSDTGAIIDKETELTRLQWQNVFVPGGGSGGTVAQVTDRIGALSGLTPGSGEMQRYQLNTDSGELEVTGSPVTVYSSVRVPVEPGKWVQAKKINGRWWVDVEDCKDDEEGY